MRKKNLEFNSKRKQRDFDNKCALAFRLRVKFVPDALLNPGILRYCLKVHLHNYRSKHWRLHQNINFRFDAAQRLADYKEFRAAMVHP